ncbi:hypothetical protein R6Q57_010059 [Mikania cordata]
MINVQLHVKRLKVDPKIKTINCSDHSEICAEGVSLSNQTDEDVERSARKSSNPPFVLNNQKSFVSKSNNVDCFQTSVVNPYNLVHDFKTKFVKSTNDIKHSNETKVEILKGKENGSNTTITKGMCSSLNPNCEPFSPKKSMEEIPINSCPGYFARHCLHRPTEFSYGKNQKVTPKIAVVSLNLLGRCHELLTPQSVQGRIIGRIQDELWASSPSNIDVGDVVDAVVLTCFYPRDDNGEERWVPRMAPMICINQNLLS